MKDKKDNKKENKNIIKCPHCGAEYLPAEIFIPNAVFGHPRNIDKNEEDGSIESYMGGRMDLSEEYTCDRCNHKFNILMQMSFKTFEVKDEEFEEVYYTPLYAQKYHLDEE